MTNRDEENKQVDAEGTEETEESPEEEKPSEEPKE